MSRQRTKLFCCYFDAARVNVKLRWNFDKKFLGKEYNSSFNTSLKTQNFQVFYKKLFKRSFFRNSVTGLSQLCVSKLISNSDFRNWGYNLEIIFFSLLLKSSQDLNRHKQTKIRNMKKSNNCVSFQSTSMIIYLPRTLRNFFQIWNLKLSKVCRAVVDSCL